MSSPDASKRRLVALAPTVAVVLLLTALIGWVQFSFPGALDSDGYFHTRAAAELAEHGPRSTFPQTAFSTWSERYSDKDLLFHAVLIPFQWASAGDDLLRPGKWASVFCALVFFSAFAFTLVSTGVRAPWAWLLLFFVSDAPVLYPFLLIRPGLLGMAFLLVEIALLLRGRYRLLVAAGLLHAWAHSSFVLLPALALALAVAHLLRGEKLPWRSLVAAAAGPLLGLIVNPYFPNTFTLAWDQLAQVALSAWWRSGAIPTYLFGSELLPARTDQFLGSWPAYLPALAAIVVALALPSRKRSTGAVALVIAAGGLLAAGFLSERFLRFFFPFAVLCAARLWSELLGDGAPRDLLRRERPVVIALALVGALCFAGGLSDGSVLSLRQQVRGAPGGTGTPPAIEFLIREAAPDELVYHQFWWDFSILYHYRPDGRYVVALDPVFMLRHDPERFRLAVEAYEGRTQDLYGVLKGEFGARWIYLPKVPQYAPFFNLVRGEVRFEKAYEDDQAFVVRIR